MSVIDCCTYFIVSFEPGVDAGLAIRVDHSKHVVRDHNGALG